MAERKRGLTKKQKLFADLYIAYNGNGSKAYKEAYGVKTNVATVNACRMLKNANVKNYIASKRPVIAKKVDFTVEWLRQSILDVVNSENAKPSDKLKGYELLGKTFGAFEEKQSVRFDQDMVIEVVRDDNT